MDYNQEKIAMKLLHEGQTIETVEMLLYEENPESNEEVLIELEGDNYKLKKSGDNFFSVLQEIRKELEQKNIQLMCNGAARNVYPSPMQMSMGSGRTAYLLKMMQTARIIDIVDIFECDDSLEFVGVDEQDAHYQDWFESLGKRKNN